jgi:hypothetical protein
MTSPHREAEERKKRFPIGVVLSITHDKLLTEIGNVYEILNWMLDENLYTHQLPRAGKFCRPFLRAQLPQLEEWDIYDAQVNTENWRGMLNKAVTLFGETLEVEKPPPSVWTEKNPLDELAEMVGKEKVIVISQGDKAPCPLTRGTERSGEKTERRN